MGWNGLMTMFWGLLTDNHQMHLVLAQGLVKQRLQGMPCVLAFLNCMESKLRLINVVVWHIRAAVLKSNAGSMHELKREIFASLTLLKLNTWVEQLAKHSSSHAKSHQTSTKH